MSTARPAHIPTPSDLQSSGGRWNISSKSFSRPHTSSILPYRCPSGHTRREVAKKTWWLNKVSLGPYTALQAGGAAQKFLIADSADRLAELALECQTGGIPLTVLGMG